MLTSDNSQFFKTRLVQDVAHRIGFFACGGVLTKLDDFTPARCSDKNVYVFRRSEPVRLGLCKTARDREYRVRVLAPCAAYQFDAF